MAEKNRTEYKNQYLKENYDSIRTVWPKGIKPKVQTEAKKQGLSLNAYTLEAVKEKYKKDTGEEL